MDINENSDSPLTIKVSFNKLLEHYETLAVNSDHFLSAKAKRILNVAKPHPILREGFSDLLSLKKYEDEMKVLLQDFFNPILTQNEIKTASVPFQNIIFNSSNRFQKIIKAAGSHFDPKIENMPEKDLYIVACTIILKFCYGYDLNFKRPLYYKIPDKNGVQRFYKILYNADYTEIIPTPKAKTITQEDYNELLDNYDNIDMWKEKFPPDSYIFKGFVISNIFDVTDDQSISNIKSSLIGDDKRNEEGFMENFHEIFRSLLGLKNIRVGFSIYNEEHDTFERVYGVGMHSFLLNDKETASCADSLCHWSYNRLLKDSKYFTLSDVDRDYNSSKGQLSHIKILKEQHIKSAIFAPIANDKGLMGILEIVSEKPKLLNSVNANKLVDVMPYIVSAVERSKAEEENLVEAIIQQECTSIHPSVHWRFVREARAFIKSEFKGEKASFRKIAFKNVYPLYGQIDIKGSSEARNEATKQDLLLQLEAARRIFKAALKIQLLPVYEQLIYQVNNFLEAIKNHFQVDSEQEISSFFKEEVAPVFQYIYNTGHLKDLIKLYFDSVDDVTNMLYKNRKNYDTTVATINKEMSRLLDKKQVKAQAMYPHYFERFKTDGVEHNMYIGESIAKNKPFSPIYLYNLRLWQLQVMCEMENAYYQMQPTFPVTLDVASMVLVFSQPLSVSFRMDEKQFDVDGTYNARYEIVKKRVDKAYIKGTKNRITEKGKITIVYSQKQDEKEYLKYIKFLQSKGYLNNDVEVLEIEDLQAVTGLKALRVSVLYKKKEDHKSLYTYNDLMAEIRS